ncbi:zinc ribbon domain-containing protein [Bifidobacterium pseudocatenulatum]|uniref:zinc ribbon domain-containing protein n=1 Tax=Bifidobacterium pseudocatenulatum TaxID=28026 RepID=UPI001CFBB2F5|nr:zinc ribbon domain-containing protein [Bifidobacterium pseudocatenulatum]MCB4896407.1 zinc ribbon domain-containing protein [Bifidobacterium pseudocatenulatum]
MSKSIKYVECAHCGEVVGTYYVTCPYCGYKLAARELAARRPTGMDPLYGMTDDEFYRELGSM